MIFRRKIYVTGWYLELRSAALGIGYAWKHSLSWLSARQAFAHAHHGLPNAEAGKLLGWDVSTLSLHIWTKINFKTFLGRKLGYKEPEWDQNGQNWGYYSKVYSLLCNYFAQKWVMIKLPITLFDKGPIKLPITQFFPAITFQLLSNYSNAKLCCFLNETLTWNCNWITFAITVIGNPIM